MDEDWDLLLGFLPADWKQTAAASGALKGLRQDKDPGDLLRVLLMHVACGYSLRETVVRAREAGLADMSDVALLKRLRKCEPWLWALCRGLFQDAGVASAGCGARELRLIDATQVKEPGKSGGFWRVHYSLTWPGLRCDYMEVCPLKGAGNGETLSRYRAGPGEHLVADRGYSSAQGIGAVVGTGADVTVRLNAQNVRLSLPGGGSFDLEAALAGVGKTGQKAEWDVVIADGRGKNKVGGRLCVLRKTRAAIELAKRKIRKAAGKRGTKVNEATWRHAEFVMVFSTVGRDEMDAGGVLELYRIRWQIELAFKRFKQLATLGHLPKRDPGSSRAWLQAKLLAVLLTEKLLATAESVSPWGYEIGRQKDSEAQ